jgi:cobalt-zinc-cadmium efflux system outer membrane protein
LFVLSVKTRVPAALLLLLCAAFTNAARAQDASARAPAPAPAGAGTASAPARFFTLAEAIQLGAAAGPGIAIAKAPRAGGELALREASPLPRSPVLTATAGYRVGAVTPGAELGATAMQDISINGLGSARKRAAQALIDGTDADVTRARLFAAARAGFAHMDVVLATSVLKLRTDAVKQAEEIVKTARARVGSGVAQPFEVAISQGDLGTARAAMFDAEGTRVEALAELRYSLGLPADANVDATGDLAATDERPVDATTVLHAAETSHPSLVVAKARANQAHEEATLAHATLSPPIAVGASYLHEGTGEQIIMGIVSFPLPFGNPANYEAARQTAVADTWLRHVDRESQEISRDVRLALHDREHWREVRDALSKEAVVPMREAVRLARVQYEAGTQDVSSVLVARQRLLQTEEQLARAQAEVQRADLRVKAVASTLLQQGTR